MTLRGRGTPPSPQSREYVMAGKDKDLNDLFLDPLKDIYFAEKLFLTALP
jgi:hypothetical protein